jgi:hypothetical protein
MESAKIAALQEALLAEGRTWGNVMYRLLKLEKGRRAVSAKRRQPRAAAAVETMRKSANIEKKKAKFVNRRGQLTKIAEAV